jgi:hypothetical protein
MLWISRGGPGSAFEVVVETASPIDVLDVIP